MALTASEPSVLGLAYERFSTDNQSSTEEQMAVNEELAEDEGVTIVHHFDDEGIPRSLSDRPGLLAMFDYVEEHSEIRFIVVNELERLTAGISQRAKVTSMCKRLGITLLTEDMGLIDPHDEDKMHEADQRAVASAGEVLKIRRRTRRMLRQKARRGVSILRPPYGTQMFGGGQMGVHPDELPWLIQMFDWAAEGVALAEIRRRLNAEGVPTKGGKDHWSTTAIRGILDNPFYKGEMVWGKRRTLRDEHGRKYREVRDADDPEVITRESPLGELIPKATWNRVQQLKEASAGTRVRTVREPRVFDNRVFCARCGYKMYARDNGRRGVATQWQYTCETKNRPARTGLADYNHFLCTTPHSISISHMIAAMAGGSETRGLTIDTTVTLGSGGNYDRRRRRWETQIEQANAEQDRVTRLAIKGRVSEELLDETIADCERRIAEAEAALLDIETMGGIDVAPFRGAYAVKLAEIAERLADGTMPTQLKWELLDRAGLERITVDKPVLRLHFRE